MVGREGFEPSTNGLKGRCSTAELPARGGWKWYPPREAGGIDLIRPTGAGHLPSPRAGVPDLFPANCPDCQPDQAPDSAFSDTPSYAPIGIEARFPLIRGTKISMSFHHVVVGGWREPLLGDKWCARSRGSGSLPWWQVVPQEPREWLPPFGSGMRGDAEAAPPFGPADFPAECRYFYQV